MLFKKLNEDSSWWWDLAGIKLLVDPWFTESQVDLAPWFSRQYHLAAQPLIEELNHPDFLFISNTFTDHCNKETLLQFDSRIPLIASEKVLRKIRRWRHFSQLLTLEHAPFSIERCSSGKWLDLVHDVYLFSTNEGKVLYAPHGSQLKAPPKTDVLITTTAQYALPFWLGGTVNLGLEHALSLKQRSEAKVLLTTHDEAKRGEGIVERLARKKYQYEPNEACMHLSPGETYRFADG